MRHLLLFISIIFLSSCMADDLASVDLPMVCEKSDFPIDLSAVQSQYDTYEATATQIDNSLIQEVISTTATQTTIEQFEFVINSQTKCVALLSHRITKNSKNHKESIEFPIDDFSVSQLFDIESNQFTETKQVLTGSNEGRLFYILF